MVNNRYFFHFGTAQDSLEKIQKQRGCSSIIVLDQVHGNKGVVITQPLHEASSYAKASADTSAGKYTITQGEGDFLVTNLCNIGLGVLTADCLPIIFIDQKNHAVGIAHAGWRGAVQSIAAEVVRCMQQSYGTCPPDLSIFFGPCAHVCCYEVQEDFLQHLKSFSFADYAIQRRNSSLFFDQITFNTHILLSLGIPKNAITSKYSLCTIGDHNYFSYRRQGDAAGRNVSVVYVK